MDAFYASVEQRDDPSLKGKAIAVGGGEKRGVTTTASYEARKFGVKSAMPGWKAKALCPELIFVKPRFEAYKEVSSQIRGIFKKYTDVFEPLSLDEAYLDVTENKINQVIATEIAIMIKKDIFETTGLTASAGVSYCKFLAKIASDFNKPNGITVIKPHQALDFLSTLPVRKFFGVGKVTAEKMEQLGIHTGSDLRQWTKNDLMQHFGKAGSFYYDIVRGIDNRPVEPYRPRKSYAVERTLDENMNDLEEIHNYVDKLAEQLFAGLCRANYFGRTLTLKVKNQNFIIKTRSISLPYLLNKKEEIKSLAHQLIDKNESLFKEVRLLGLTISNADNSGQNNGQLTLDL